MSPNIIDAIPALYQKHLTEATFFLNEDTDTLFNMYSASPNHPTEEFSTQAETVVRLQYCVAYLTFLVKCFPQREPRT